MLDLVQNIKFKPVRDKFLSELSKKHQEDQRREKLTHPSRQTNQLLHNATSEKQLIIREKHHEILQEVFCLCCKQATMPRKIYSLLTQDRRQNRHYSKKRSLRHAQGPQAKFANKTTCRLINPTKSEIGKISKIILG